MIAILLSILGVLILGVLLGLMLGLFKGASLGFWQYRTICLSIYAVYLGLTLPFDFIRGAMGMVILLDLVVLFAIGCFAQAVVLFKARKSR